MATNFEDVCQRGYEPEGRYKCKFLWPDGDGFGAMMHELPKEVYVDSLGKRMWFGQSDQDKTVYLFLYEEHVGIVQ